MQKSLKISIMGKLYSIMTDEDDGSIEEAAQIVDDLMKSKMGNSSLSEEKIAVVVALQLAAEMKKKSKLIEYWQRKAEDLNNLINKEFLTLP